MERRYDIDWVRDIVVLSIIFFHSLIIFMTRESAVMYIRSGVDIPFCIYTEAVMSRFCMPILFILAGFSARLSLEKRSTKEFLMQRVRKLFLPFLIMSFTVNPITSYIYGISIGRNISFAAHYKYFVTSISENFESRTTGYGPMHLWFILYLFLFSLICVPLFAHWKTEKSKKVFQKIADFLSKPFLLLLVVVPYVCFFFVDIMDEMNPLAYLYLFLLGYILSTDERYQQVLDRQKWFYLAFSVLMIVGSMYGWFFYNGGKAGAVFLQFHWFYTKSVRILLPFSIMGIAHTYIKNKSTAVLSYLNGANYPIYLYHMCVLTFVGYMVLKIPMSPMAQFLCINVLSYGVSFFIYHFMIRPVKMKW